MLFWIRLLSGRIFNLWISRNLRMCLLHLGSGDLFRYLRKIISSLYLFWSCFLWIYNWLLHLNLTLILWFLIIFHFIVILSSILRRRSLFMWRTMFTPGMMFRFCARLLLLRAPLKALKLAAHNHTLHIQLLLWILLHKCIHLLLWHILWSILHWHWLVWNIMLMWTIWSNLLKLLLSLLLKLLNLSLHLGHTVVKSNLVLHVVYVHLGCTICRINRLLLHCWLAIWVHLGASLHWVHLRGLHHPLLSQRRVHWRKSKPRHLLGAKILRNVWRNVLVLDKLGPSLVFWPLLLFGFALGHSRICLLKHPLISNKDVMIVLLFVMLCLAIFNVVRLLLRRRIKGFVPLLFQVLCQILVVTLI